MGQQQRTSSDAASVRRGLTAPSRHEAHVGKKNAQLATRHCEAGLQISGMRRGIEIYKLRRFASKKRGAGANLGSTLVIDVVRGGEARSSSSPHVIYGACITRLRTSIPD
jgi:hypothetical protein